MSDPTLKIFYMTFGCKVNQYETQNIAERFEKLGAVRTFDLPQADVCFINSCTVTSQADGKLRQFISRVKRENPRCIKVVAGCFTQAFPEKAAELGCEILVGSRNKSDVPKLVLEYLKNFADCYNIVPHRADFEPMCNNGNDGKTRAYIKIQDGCDHACTYCIIPSARGSVCSKPLVDIEREARMLIGSGHKELILTGINLCCYGKDLGGLRLIDAVERVCAIEGDFRVRLGSIEPELISDEDIERMSAQKKLCAHFHLSLQSGCDRTLAAMKRRYNSEQYKALCSKLRAAFPNCAITTDIMVGFPDETWEDHESSMRFADEIGFAAAHIFPYSRREGTVADRLKGQIDGKEKSARAKQMSEVCGLSQLRYHQSFVGKTVEVLFEREGGKPYHCGHSREYIEVRTEKCCDTLRREIRTVRITEAHEKYCFGELV